MSTYSYQPVFTMDVFHGYFGKEPCRCIGFVPGPASRKIFSRYDFLTMKKSRGFDLCVNTPSALQDYLTYISSTTGYTYFDFELVLSDELFYQYTDFPVDETGPMVFNSNNLSGTNADGSMLLNMQVQNDTGSLQAGIVTIHFADIMQYAMNRKVAGFALQFGARYTQWQYYIINRSALSLDNLGIVGKSSIGFEGPSQVTIPTGEQALLFSSGTTLIPLSVMPQYKFDLVNYSKLQNTTLSTAKTAAYKTIFKGLPNPNPGQMDIEQAKGQNRVSSPMYVYI